MNTQPISAALSAAPWRLLNGNCGGMLGIMSALNKPVAMLGLATALNPKDMDALICVPELVEVLELLVRWLDQNPTTDEELETDDAMGWSLEAKARAVLAKLQGETDASLTQGAA